MAPIRQPIASDGTGPNTRAQVAEHVPAPHQNTAHSRPPSRPVTRRGLGAIGSGSAPRPETVTIAPMRAVGYGMVTAGAVLWGLNGPVSRMILDAGVEPRQLAGWRIMSAAVLMTVTLVVLRRMRFRCSRRALVSIVLFGLFGVALPQWLYYEAISRFDVGLTLVIVYTAPLWVAGIHRVTRGTRQPRQVTAAMALALVGIAIAVLGGGELSNGSVLGLILAISTSIAYAAAADAGRAPRPVAAGQLARGAVDDRRRRVLAACCRPYATCRPTCCRATCRSGSSTSRCRCWC